MKLQLLDYTEQLSPAAGLANVDQFVNELLRKEREHLAIQEGSQASLEYLRMKDPATPANERARIRKDLLIYCGQDTLAMVKIRETLLKRF